MAMFWSGCENSDDPQPTEQDYVNLLTNQVTEVIIPSMENYAVSLNELSQAADQFSMEINPGNLAELQQAFRSAYLIYQNAAIHNYFATANQALIETSNLFPIDTNLLEELISNERYDFATTAQMRANGFPAMDYMLYGTADALSYFQQDSKRLVFLQALITFMKDKSEVLANQWKGNLKDNFIDNGGTALGSSLSVQLNETMVYWETHIRENKVGIPIGRLGPNDSPIPADPTKIEAYYLSENVGDESFTLDLLRAAVKGMEDVYLGRNGSGVDGQGYDDLLIARQQPSVDEDIKNQFQIIYDVIEDRVSISGDDELYNALQQIVTIYKSDLFPILNVQDADGKNDGD